MSKFTDQIWAELAAMKRVNVALTAERDALASQVTTARSQVDAALAERDALALQLQAAQAALADVLAEHTATVAERDDLKRRRENLLRFMVEDVAELFDDVWHQFAAPGTVKGETKLWAGGLSTLEDVEAMRETLASFPRPEPAP